MALKSWRDFQDELGRAVGSVDDKTLTDVALDLRCADIVLTAGNGGSACLASHLAQALAKPDYVAGGGHPAVCLTDHTPTLTAHANDGGWATAIEESARPFLTRGLRCCVVIISSSGKSENLCNLAKLAVNLRHRVIALTGFEGEPLRGLSHISIHVDSHDYEIVEPAHDALIHRIQGHLRG